MAAPPVVRRARRSLISLFAIAVALVGIISIGVAQGEATWTPKLALDLQGGTQILLAAKQTDGQTVTGEQLNQAVAIIRQRVNASGVSEAEVTTQGNQHISVSIPGKADEATLQRIEASAQLQFRPVLAVGYPGLTTTPDTTGDAATNEGDTPATGDATADTSATADAATDETDANADTSTTDTAQADTAQADTADLGPRDPEVLPEGAGDLAWLTPALQQEFNDFTCDSDAALSAGDAPSDRPLVTCDQTGSLKYILGPVELGGDVITNAVAQPAVGANGAQTGGWAIQITLNSEGTSTFGKISTRMYGATSPLDQFAFVLDGQVLSAPRMQAQILDGRPSISGDFTQESAKTLADQLKFGALPIGFTVQSQEDISSTLGANQLQMGLLAGLIGLMLVVVYSLFQYRTLGSVTVASLAIAAILTYLMLTLLSWRQGYRLSLAGVAGVIVAVGITADSFIVYFERIRDALRDGFQLEAAVEQGWKKAIRTVLASDGINFLAAAILFLLAIGNVRGFAFTLGLTTIIDVLVVSLFTHPMLTLLARTKFFGGGHPASGLDPRQLGAVYRGRAQFRDPVIVSAKGGSSRKVKGSQREAQRRQTIAERKAAEALSSSTTSGKES